MGRALGVEPQLNERCRSDAVKGGGKGPLKKSAPLNAEEKQVFNVVENRKATSANDKNV